MYISNFDHSLCRWKLIKSTISNADLLLSNLAAWFFSRFALYYGWQFVAWFLSFFLRHSRIVHLIKHCESTSASAGFSSNPAFFLSRLPNVAKFYPKVHSILHDEKKQTSWGKCTIYSHCQLNTASTNSRFSQFVLSHIDKQRRDFIPLLVRQICWIFLFHNFGLYHFSFVNILSKRLIL